MKFQFVQKCKECGRHLLSYFELEDRCQCGALLVDPDKAMTFELALLNQLYDMECKLANIESNQ